jgi:hypothetical protein
MTGPPWLAAVLVRWSASTAAARSSSSWHRAGPKITPEQADLATYGGNRRVKGLRREEVALLAGVSVDYCVRSRVPPTTMLPKSLAWTGLVNVGCPRWYSHTVLVVNQCQVAGCQPVWLSSGCIAH